VEQWPDSREKPKRQSEHKQGAAVSKRSFSGKVPSLNQKDRKLTALPAEIFPRSPRESRDKR
jgi:hypothetical protein